MGKVTFRELPVAKLGVADENLRRLRGSPEAEAALKESIATNGVMVPLIVQAHGKGYGVLAGSRRLRAAKALGLKTVPCLIRAANGADARIVSATENTLRVDFAPLEEAEIYAGLAKRHETVDALAAALGRSATYIHGRLALRRLHEDAKRALTDGRLPLGQALELARCGPGDQQRLLGRATVGAVRGLRADIAALRTPLRFAAWDLADAKLDAKAGACTVCPLRTGTTPALFPECGPDLCTSRGCYDGKAQRTCERIRRERPDLALLIPDENRGGAPVIDGHHLAPWDWKVAKPDAKGAAEGLIVAGPRAGRIVWFLATSGKMAGAAKPDRRDAAAEDRKRLARDLVEPVWEALHGGVEGLDFVVAALLDRLGGDDRRALAKVWPDKAAVEALRGKTEDGVGPLRRAFAACESPRAAGHLLGRLAAAVVVARAGATGYRWTEALALVKAAGVDVKAVEAVIVAQRAAKVARAKKAEAVAEKVAEAAEPG